MIKCEERRSSHLQTPILQQKTAVPQIVLLGTKASRATENAQFQASTLEMKMRSSGPIQTTSRLKTKAQISYSATYLSRTYF